MPVITVNGSLSGEHIRTTRPLHANEGSDVASPATMTKGACQHHLLELPSPPD